MGFGYLNPDATKLDLARRIASPGPAPEASFSLWSFGKAGLAGIPSAAFEIYGSTQDFMRGLDQSRAEDEARIAQAFGRAPKSVQIAEGGEVARLKADRFAPDPETAHTADQVMHGLTRFVGKAVGAVATTGPVAGPVLVGLEEGNTTAQRLMEGPSKVDKETAMKVGAVQGVMAGIGVALPAGGSTALRTAGIALAGGPATFVAQETLAKKILAQAGYAEEAAKRDPTDPLGLALSTIAPFAVGGLHLRGLAKAKAADDLRAKREGLSYAKEADLKDTAALSPAEQAASDAFERSAGNIKELEAAIKAEKNPQNKAILEAELQKLGGKAKTEIENAAIVKAAEDPEIVAAARVHLTEQVVSRDMPDIPGAHAEVLRAADSLAAGRMPEVRPIPDYELPTFKAWFGDSKVVREDGAPMVVYHATSRDFDTFQTRGNQTSSADRLDAAFFTDSADYAEEYAKAIGGSAQTMPTYLSLRNPLLVDADPRGFADPRYEQPIIQQARQAGHDGVVFRDPLTNDRFYAVFEPTQIKSALGNSGKFDPNSGSLTDPLRPGEVSPRESFARETAPRETVSADTQALETSARQEAMPTAKTEAAPPVDSQRLAKLEAENPDLPVMLPGETEAKTLSEALAEARATAADEASFADLVKVAAECALTAG
jgi:hypothetical protein